MTESVPLSSQLNRRVLMGVGLIGAGVGLGGGLAGSARAARGAKDSQPHERRLAGSMIHGQELGIVADSGRDSTQTLQNAIDLAAERRATLVLPAGRHFVSGLQLRRGSAITSSAGAGVLQHIGGAPLISAQDIADVSLKDLTLSGGPAMTNGAKALVQLVAVDRIVLDRLNLVASPAHGIALERCSGVISHCKVTDAVSAAIFSLDATGMEISNNQISDCANNGILVWASTKREDGTIIAMNRIERIASRAGGTGQNGNGINIYRAGNVSISNNRIADCAFSAVRANSASDVEIVANSVSRAGEMAIYVEFAFEGAVIADNLVHGAAGGISVTNFKQGGRLAVVQGNLVRDIVSRPDEPLASGHGILVEADAAVSGNVIENAHGAGISIGWGPFRRDVVATGNVIRGSSIGIGLSSASQGGAVLVANNLISGARDGAIRQLDHGRPVGTDISQTMVPPSGISLHGNVVA